jgi:hypothetical protein
VKAYRVYTVVLYGYLALMAALAVATRQAVVIAFALVGYVGIWLSWLVYLGWMEGNAAGANAHPGPVDLAEPTDPEPTRDESHEPVETLVDQLDRLERMHRNGLISADEYEAKRARLIARF